MTADRMQPAAGARTTEQSIRRAMAQLVVTTSCDGAEDRPRLLVDAGALARGPSDCRFWDLCLEDDGTWSHIPSGEIGHPLSDHLWSIAAVYLTPPMHHRHEGSGAAAQQPGRLDRALAALERCARAAGYVDDEAFDDEVLFDEVPVAVERLAAMLLHPSYGDDATGDALT